MSDWLVEEDDAQYYPEHIGPGTLHRDRESSPLYPGSLAKRYYSDSSPPDNVVVVECPDEPAGSVFNNETGRYEAKDRVYDPNVAQIGIVDISAFSDDLFVEISSLAWRNLYSLITKPVSEAASIQYVRSNELEQLCGVQNLSQPVEAAPVEEWWEDQ